MPRDSLFPGSETTKERLLQTLQRMLRARSVASLLDLAYDAVRDGLSFDRVGIFTVEHGRRLLVERIGTDEHGHRIYPSGRIYPLDSGAPIIGFLIDPRMAAGGAGYILEPSESEVRAADELAPETLRVAVRTASTMFGFISVDNLLTVRPIAESDIAQVVAYANVLALALENASLLEQRDRRIESLDADIRKHAAELEALSDVGSRVNEAATLDEVLDIVYETIRDRLGYDRVGIVLLDRERETFEERIGTDEYGAKTRPRDRVIDLGTESHIWESPELVALLAGASYYYTPDLYADTPPEQRYLLDGEPKHNLAIPLRSGGKLTGLISVDNFVTGRAFDEDAAVPLIALANVVGSAVERARLLERERQERARLEVLLETAHALNSTLDSDRILAELAARMVNTLDASIACFIQVDRRNATIRSLAQYAAAGAEEISDEARGAAEHYRTIEAVLDSGEPFEGIAGETIARDRDFLTVHGLKAELLIPLVVRGVAVGVLEVYWRQPTQAMSDIRMLCIALAEQAAVALRNADLYAQATQLAERDPLTGLLNHRALLESLDHSIMQAEPFGLLLIDVDNFKLINDTHGHLAGDAVLTQIASTLQAACRDADRAGRYGGDEFAVILQGVRAEEIDHVVRRIDESVRARIYATEDRGPVSLSVSIGTASFPADGSNRRELLSAADSAMYVAKRAALAQRRTS